MLYIDLIRDLTRVFSAETEAGLGFGGQANWQNDKNRKAKNLSSDRERIYVFAGSHTGERQSL